MGHNMLSREELDKFRQRVYEFGLIDETEGNCIRFEDKAQRIIKKTIITGWAYFVYDHVQYNYVHYWMPYFYSEKSIQKKECWKFVKEGNLTQEMIDKFYEFFGMTTEDSSFKLTSEVEFMDI